MADDDQRPRCASIPKRVFYPYDIDDEAEQAELLTTAVEACRSCPVSLPCLTGAMDRAEGAGVWAGIDFELAADELERAIEAREADDFGQMVKELEAAAEITARAMKGDRVRPWQEARPCERCESHVEAGTHPRDRNGPGATCGYPSTFNRGCRCVKCKEGKASYQAGS